MVGGQQGRKLENNTLIHTVVRDAAVQGPAFYENDIACLCCKLCLIQCNEKFSFDDADELIFNMPVIGHLVAGMACGDVIKFNGKVKSPVGLLFLITDVFHRISPFFSNK